MVVCVSFAHFRASWRPCHLALLLVRPCFAPVGARASWRRLDTSFCRGRQQFCPRRDTGNGMQAGGRSCAPRLAPDRLDVFSTSPDVWICCFSRPQQYPDVLFCMGFPISNGPVSARLHVFSAGPNVGFCCFSRVQQYPDVLD